MGTPAGNPGSARQAQQADNSNPVPGCPGWRASRTGHREVASGEWRVASAGDLCSGQRAPPAGDSRLGERGWPLALRSAARHSPLAPRHSPLATRHSPLATRHSSRPSPLFPPPAAGRRQGHDGPAGRLCGRRGAGGRLRGRRRGVRRARRHRLPWTPDPAGRSSPAATGPAALARPPDARPAAPGGSARSARPPHG